MLMNCNYFWCVMFGSVFYFGDVFENVCLIMVMCLGARVSLVLCMDYTKTDCYV
jgi:hypothetical protein